MFDISNVPVQEITERAAKYSDIYPAKDRAPKDIITAQQSHTFVCHTQTCSKALCTFMVTVAEMLLPLTQTVNTQVSQAFLKGQSIYRSDILGLLHMDWIKP